MPITAQDQLVRVTVNRLGVPDSGTTPVLVMVGGASALRPTFLALTDADNVAIDAGLGERFYLATTRATVTLDPPVNPEFNTEPLTLAYHNTSGSASQLVLDTGAGGFSYTQAIASISPTPAGKVDFFTFIYLSQKTTWFLVGQAREI
jgi:hypothetical protein